MSPSPPAPDRRYTDELERIIADVIIRLRQGEPKDALANYTEGRLRRARARAFPPPSD